MPASPNPFRNMENAELQQRFRGFYPPSATQPEPIQTAPDTRTRSQLAADPANAAYYPGGKYGPKIPDLPKPEIDQRQFLTPEQLRTDPANKAFYDPPTPIDNRPISDLPAKWNVPDTFTGLPQMPVEAPQGQSLGSSVAGLAGGAAGAIGAGIGSGIVGILSGESPDVAIGQGLGTGIGVLGGAALGGAIGALGGPPGVAIGANVGATLGGFLGGALGANLAQNIHNLFFPPKSVYRPIPGPREPFPPLTGSRRVYYRVKAIGKFKNQELTNFENVFLGPLTGMQTIDHDGLKTYQLGWDGGLEIAGYMTGAESTFDQPPVITSIEPVDGSHDPLNAPPVPLYPPQVFNPNPGNVPFGVDFGQPDPRPSLPPTLPQAQPAPGRTPILEPPAPANSPTPKFSPTPNPSIPGQPGPSPGTPSGQPGTGTSGGTSGRTNINDLPGLFGLPFLLPFLPFNKQSPSGSLNLDSGNGPTGTGKPPKAPTNSPCSGACQKAIEGRIQGVDDKVAKLMQQANNAGQDAALAEILRRLAVLDTKVGAQVPGGLSGFLGFFRQAFDKLSEWLHLDRLLNIMTFIVTLQNAYFLTDSLKIVTLQMLSDGLNVLGFKDKDGNGLNLNKLLDKTIEDMLKSVLGVDTLEGMKKEWKALSRIYQAGSNIIYAFQNIAWSILNALDIIGSWNAQIGNALKKYGVVGHNAFAWLNPAPNFHNKFFTAVTNALNIVSNIDFVAQSIIQGRDAVDQITKQSEEFTKDFTDLTNPKPPEHKPTATAEAGAVTHSQSPPVTQEHINTINQ